MALGGEVSRAENGINSYPVLLARPCLLAGEASFGAMLATNAREPVGAIATFAPGLIQVFVGTANELHLLAWRPRALQRAPLAIVVPVQTAHLDAAWRKALLPSADIGKALRHGAAAARLKTAFHTAPKIPTGPHYRLRS